MVKTKSKFSGKAFVVFASTDDVDKVFNYEKMIFRKCWRITKSLCSKMDKVYPLRADEPNDILWEHLALTDCWRFGRRLLTIIIGLSFNIFCLFICLYINTIKSNTSGKYRLQIENGENVPASSYYTLQGWSGLIALSIIIFNEAGRLCLLYFVDEEKHQTQSKF